MPLRITIELIPRGDESRKRKLAVVNIENDGTAKARTKSQARAAAKARWDKARRLRQND